MNDMPRADHAPKIARARLRLFGILTAAMMGVVAALVLWVAPAFAAVAFRAAASDDQNGSALTLTINRPAGTLGGDLMVAGIAIRPNTATITPPAGWTLVRRQNNANPNASSLAVYYKVAGTAEPASYAWTFNTSTGSAGGISSFSGVNTTAPINVEAGAGTGATSTTSFAAPSVTTTVTNTMIVTHHEYTSSERFTPPGGMTEAFDVASLATPNANGVAVTQDYRLQAAAAATGTMTAVAAGNADVGNMDTLALRPLVCTAPGNVAYAAATAQAGQAVLYWSSANPVVVLRKVGAFAGEAPANGTVYTVGMTSGLGAATVAYVGSAAGFTQTGLSNGTTYNFRVFPYTTGPGPCYATGAGSDVTARPVAAGGNEQWSYMLAGGSALKPPITGEGGDVYLSSNAGRIISLNTADGAQRWAPPATTAAVQGYVVWTSFGAGGSYALAGDQSGRIYAVDTSDGAMIGGPLPGVTAIQAGISVQIRAYSNAAFGTALPGTYDVVLAATSNASTTNNKVIALRTDTSSVLWTFNPCSPTCTQNVDQITGQPWVDYARNRIYVTSRAGASGTQSSLWVLNSLTGAVVTSFTLGHISTAPTLSWDANTLWVGNENGDLYAVDLTPGTPALKWTGPLALGAAARLKGWVWEDWYTSERIYFSTNNGTVRCFQDPGVGGTPSAAAVCAGWSAVSTAVAGATTGVFLDMLYVGSWNGSLGRIVAIDPATGAAGTPFNVGDGTRQVGDLSTENGTELFVGTTEGKIFKITLPLP